MLECERFHSEDADKAWHELLIVTPLEHEKHIFQMLKERGEIVNDDAEEPDAAGNELVFWELEKRYLDEGRKDLLNLWGEKVRFGGTKK